MKKILISILILSVIIIYVIVANKKIVERERELFRNFDSSNIHGKLDYVKIKYHLSAFRMQGHEELYFFDPITSELNDNKIFEYFAEKGDSIIKEPYADILHLKKQNGISYYYQFRDL